MSRECNLRFSIRYLVAAALFLLPSTTVFGRFSDYEKIEAAKLEFMKSALALTPQEVDLINRSEHEFVEAIEDMKAITGTDAATEAVLLENISVQTEKYRQTLTKTLGSEQLEKYKKFMTAIDPAYAW